MSAAPARPSGLFWRSPAGGWVGAAALLALAALAALFIADRLYNPQHFRIEQIEVRGSLQRVDGARIKEVVHGALAGNYFSLDLPTVEARIEELPWVFSAAVRRRWPATVAVEVVEVQPVAMWGAQHWVHASGALVKRQTAAREAAEIDRDHGLIKAHLPVLFGPPSLQPVVWQGFQRWAGLFAEHGLGLRRLTLDARGLWRLEFAAQAAVVDGAPPALVMVAKRADAEARLASFVAALAQLRGEFPAMRSVDLRHPNGFAVGWTPARLASAH